MVRIRFFLAFLLLVFFMTMTGQGVYAREEVVQKPKEYGVYIKTRNSTVRLTPNIVFDDGGLIFVESNNPQTFALKDIQYFIIYGHYDMNVLTFNPMLFYQASSLGKPRFVFGKDIEIVVKKQKVEHLYTVRPKGLFSRGYFSLWINDTAWDFVIE